MCGWCREISTDTSLQIYKSSLHPRGQTGTVMFFSEQIAHQTVKLLGDTHPEQCPLFPCNFAYIRDFQVHEVHGQIQTHIGGSRTNHPHTQVAPGAFSFPETNRFLMGPCAARGYGLPAVSPLHRCDCAWAPPAVEPGMKPLMRAYRQQWVDSPDEGVGHGRVIFTGRLTGQAF